MKSVFLNRLIKKISKKKWLFVLSVLLFGGIFLYLGREEQCKIMMTVEEKATSEDITESAEYQAAVQSYDDSIATVQESIDVVNQQLQIQRQYCNNSPYMQLDSNNYFVASIVYTLQLAADDTTGVSVGEGESADYSGQIMAVVAQYMNANHLSSVIQNQMPEMNVEYLSEILSCSVNGNYVIISASYKDKEGALEIRDIVEKDLQEHILEQSKPYSEKYELKVIDDVVITKGDLSVLNTQSGNLNNLKSYQTSLADLQKKVADLQAAKQQYMTSAVATTETADKTDNPRTVMIRYGVIGVLIGLLFPLIVLGVMLIIDDKIKDIQDICHFGLFTFGSLQDESAIENLITFFKKRNIKNVFFSFLTESIAESEMKKIEGLLENNQTNSSCGYLDQRSEGDLKQFVSADGCIFVIALERTSTVQIQEQLQLCQRLDIPVFGCIQLQ